MELQETMKLIVQIGIFGALFIWLLKDVMKKNDEREIRLNNTIDKVNDCVIGQLKEIDNTVENIKGNVEEIKEDVESIKQDVIDIKRDVEVLKFK